MKHHLYLVYTCKGRDDCTNRGLTSRVSQGRLFWDCSRDEAIAWCNANGERPEDQFYLVERELWGENHAFAEPLIKPDGMMQTFGGNYIDACGSGGYNHGYCRTTLPLPVHDRFETWNEAGSLSI